MSRRLVLPFAAAVLAALLLAPSPAGAAKAKKVHVPTKADQRVAAAAGAAFVGAVDRREDVVLRKDEVAVSCTPSKAGWRCRAAATTRVCGATIDVRAKRLRTVVSKLVCPGAPAPLEASKPGPPWPGRWSGNKPVDPVLSLIAAGAPGGAFINPLSDLLGLKGEAVFDIDGTIARGLKATASWKQVLGLPAAITGTFPDAALAVELVGGKAVWTGMSCIPNWCMQILLAEAQTTATITYRIGWIPLVTVVFGVEHAAA